MVSMIGKTYRLRQKAQGQMMAALAWLTSRA
jgi:hypothetical protein